ncbi:MAG: aspartyl protease family protein [Candidatus Eremiobacteraeota bacterium]|nr:aspartyl protease family protein [Candidatus Eremiobacteraeota bacterium]
MKRLAILMALLALTALTQSAAATSWQTPYQLIDNRIIIPVRINGTAGFSMVSDTGASGMTVTPEVAQRLHLAMKSAGTVGGAGAGRVSVSNARLRSLEVAGVSLGAMACTVLDLAPIRNAIGFAKLDGIVGYDVLSHYAVAVDADRETLTLSSGNYNAPPNARRVDYAVRSGFITLPARIDSVAGNVILDTGDRSSLTLFGPFARHYGFYSRAPALHSVVTGYGVGGQLKSDVFRTRLSLFGYNVGDVLTRAPVGPAGAFDSSGPSGSVGTGFLRRFNIIYDLPRKELVLWPSIRFSFHERYDPAGMWVATGARGPVVTSVLSGGPAYKAGVRSGDTILAVNGIQTATWLPIRLRSWLYDRERYSTITMMLESKTGARVSRTVHLRELI